MKKILIAVLTLSLLFTLVACGGSAPEVTQPDEQPTVSDTQPETPTTPEVEQEEETPAEPEPTPEVTPDPIPVETPEQTETPEPEPAPEQTPEVKPEPTPVPEVKPEPEQPVVTTEPTPEVIPEPEVEETPEVVETPDEEVEVEVIIPEPAKPEYGITDKQNGEIVGYQTWTEGEKHSMPKAGDTIVTKDGTKYVIQYDPISGVLGGGLDIRYDIWSGFQEHGMIVESYSNNITGRDTSTLLKDPVTGQMHTRDEWTIMIRRLKPTFKGTTEGQIANNWFKWEDNGWTWVGPY